MIMSDHIQGFHDILLVFDGSIDDGSKNCKVPGAGEGFKLPRHFLFDFDVSDRLF